MWGLLVFLFWLSERVCEIGVIFFSLKVIFFYGGFMSGVMVDWVCEVFGVFFYDFYGMFEFGGIVL